MRQSRVPGSVLWEVFSASGVVVPDAVRRADAGQRAGIVPEPVVGLGVRGRGRFVQLDAEAGAVGWIHEPVREAHILVDHILPPGDVVEQRLVDAA